MALAAGKFEHAVCPVFLCYRQADALETARWLYQALEGTLLTLQGKSQRLALYFDRASPATGDWPALHAAHLERARAMIVIISPGLRSDFRSSRRVDWVHHELDWWLKHRGSAPILVDTTGDERFIPPALARKWPNAQRLEYVPSRLDQLSSELRDEQRSLLLARVLAGIAEGESASVIEDLRRQRRLARRLRIALVTVVVLALAATVMLFAAVGTAERAERERQNVLRLAAFRELDRLREQAQRLWPMTDFPHAEADEWLTRAEALIATLEEQGPAHPGLRRLREDARTNIAAGAALAEQELWWFEQLEILVSEIEAFADPVAGLVQGVSETFGWGVARRRDMVLDLAVRSVDSEAASKAWQEARRAIRSHPDYSPLDLQPQFGLLPIGPDPISGLWEFAELSTGRPPMRSAGGKLMLADDSGLVFVLLPGGRFVMGDQDEHPSSAQGASREADEMPSHSIELAPFFLSKFELTQHQWITATGRNPSLLQPASRHERTRRALELTPYSPRFPVEVVSWNDCNRLLERLGLTLPTEAQWEYACRAHTSTDWWTGAGIDSVSGHENLVGASSVRLVDSLVEYHLYLDLLDDPFPFVAPVGSLSPNPFGLHDMHGNVMEWTLDSSTDYRTPVVPWTDGLRGDVPGDLRSFRGGSFAYSPVGSRSSNRRFGAPESSDDDLGVRPARRIRSWSGP